MSIPKGNKRKNPYTKFAEAELILRDQLAIDRTILANERTFLAYCRTCLAVIITGVVSLRFFESLFSEIFGLVIICLGLLVGVVGTWRYIEMARSISEAGAREQDTARENSSAQL